MILSTTDCVTKMEIDQMLGLVSGNSVRSRFFLRDIGAWFRNLIGGEISTYTQMMAEARNHALVRMIEAAEEKGADAIVNVRFVTSAIMRQSAEVLVYGTAVTLKEKVVA
jgi:uncharacterized protein YbjQ (UPF0145 family)